MCGRNAVFPARADLESEFDADVASDVDYRPRYNIAPGQPTEVVTSAAPDVIDRFHWGLVPPWADDPSEGLINARAETAPEKRPFAEAWESRPALVVSSGFYEWQTTGGGPKQPYRVHVPDRPAFALAGLWETWESDDGESLDCVTILTTEPNDLVEPIHDRMPVVLPADDQRRWLEADPAERADLCRPYPDDDLEAYPVSTRVNDPSNDDPSVIEPLGHEQSGLDAFG